MAGHDDDALSWAGDEPSRVDQSPRASRVEPVATPTTPKPQLPAPLLITYGILAGAYLLYTVGWVIAVQRYNGVFVASPEPLNAVMIGLGQILALAAPALWFGASVLLTRGRRPVARLLALVIGLAVVVPWPFVLGVWK